MERDNRKSHLAPQLSPTSQDLLLKTSDPPNHQNDGNHAYTPTSGEILIAGAIASPRDHRTHSQNRSPTRNGSHSGHSGHSSIGRAAGSSIHPGMGQRSATAGAIPKAATPDLTHPSGGSTATFTLPVRPAPGGPLPPAPPRKSTPDDPRRENRRQAFLPSTNGNYGNMGYPPAR